MNTNDVNTIVQAINDSGGHITKAQVYLVGLAVAAVVHLIHQAIAKWTAVGGSQGFVIWFKTGKGPTVYTQVVTTTNAAPFVPAFTTVREHQNNPPETPAQPKETK